MKYYSDEEFKKILSNRRKEYLKQLYDERYDRKGGVYEQCRDHFINQMRNEKIIKFEDV